jgi:hypothetical protein
MAAPLIRLTRPARTMQHAIITPCRRRVLLYSVSHVNLVNDDRNSPLKGTGTNVMATLSTHRRWCIGLVSALALTFFVGGCIDAELQSEFREDGSAVHTLTYTFNKEQMAAFGEQGQAAMDFSAAETQARERGLGFERIETEEVAGFRVWKEVADGSDITGTFNELTAASTTEDGTAPVNAVTGTLERSGDEYTLNVVIDSTQLFQSGGQEIDPAQLQQMSAFIQIAYIAVMPGEITETNGERLEANRVRWELPLTGQTEVRAVSSLSGGGSGGAGTLVLIGLIALLVLGGLLAVWLFSQRRRPAPDPVPVGPDGRVAIGPDPAWATSAPATSEQPTQDMTIRRPDPEPEPAPDPSDNR